MSFMFEWSIMNTCISLNPYDYMSHEEYWISRGDIANASLKNLAFRLVYAPVRFQDKLLYPTFNLEKAATQADCLQFQ